VWFGTKLFTIQARIVGGKIIRQQGIGSLQLEGGGSANCGHKSPQRFIDDFPTATPDTYTPNCGRHVPTPPDRAAAPRLERES